MSKEFRQAYFKSKLETRAEPDGDKYIEGYWAVFNQETELWPGTYEKIAPGAFDNSIKNNDIRCLFNHDSGFVLGRQSAKTLELKSDNYGLWGRVKINEEDPQAVAVYARVQRGDITGCSFGFWPISEEYEEMKQIQRKSPFVRFQHIHKQKYRQEKRILTTVYLKD